MKNTYNLTRFFTLSIILFLCFNFSYAQNSVKAKQVLDKAAAKLNRKGGATADFTISTTGVGKVSGKISVKGKKFYANTSQMKTWFNGKTQWTYVKPSNEVSISNPAASQQAKINPYKFLYIYKTGYNISMKQEGRNYIVHLKANKPKNNIKEMFVTINRTTYVPTTIKINENGTWSTITIKNFKSDNLPDSHFVFNKKLFPKVEIIDLR